MYGDMDPEIQAEEAVAEMFRDYNVGRLSMKGKPVSLFNKIKTSSKLLLAARKLMALRMCNLSSMILLLEILGSVNVRLCRSRDYTCRIQCHGGAPWRGRTCGA